MACGSNNTNSKSPEQNTTAKTEQTSAAKQIYQVEAVAHFKEPWAITSLPDQRLLVTERQGKLKIFNPQNKQVLDVQGVPAVNYGGQGGLGMLLYTQTLPKITGYILVMQPKGKVGLVQ